jgi:hypothetical protein
VNPVAVADRVLDEVHNQLSQRHALGDPNLPPEEVVATALGGWLARKFAGDSAEADRNRILAAALGACACWGQDPGCRVCASAGAPGWTMPHRDLYAHYVRPAMIAMTRGEHTDD